MGPLNLNMVSKPEETISKCVRQSISKFTSIASYTVVSLLNLVVKTSQKLSVMKAVHRKRLPA